LSTTTISHAPATTERVMFSVRVRTDAARFEYSAIGFASFDVHMTALEYFGLCAVTVTLAKAPA
jgi:hypothetical protein